MTSSTLIVMMASDGFIWRSFEQQEQAEKRVLARGRSRSSSIKRPANSSS